MKTKVLLTALAPALCIAAGLLTLGCKGTENVQEYNGHEYVDLGLSVKWATCNIGADSPTAYGDYFAWGETEPKDEYTVENCSTYAQDVESIDSNPEFDAATAAWGGDWRMPTEEEFDELYNECELSWIQEDGVYGYKITGPNGKSIFLPAAGRMSDTTLLQAMNYGYYWTSLPRVGLPEEAGSLCISNADFEWDWRGREHGQSIRPVFE